MKTIQYPFEIVTERLKIRSPSEADAHQLLAAINETLEDLKPWMPWAKPIPTFDETLENCREAEAAFKTGTDHRMHIFLRDSDTLIGGTGLHNIKTDVPKCEIGYWVRTAYGRQGYVTEAVREVTHFALTSLGMLRVEIRTSTRNVRSRKVPERLGYDLEGILRNDSRELDGTLRDTCIYSSTQFQSTIG
jgi:RimJ/RimL family protein N-acetyltransferase